MRSIIVLISDLEYAFSIINKWDYFEYPKFRDFAKIVINKTKEDTGNSVVLTLTEEMYDLLLNEGEITTFISVDDVKHTLYAQTAELAELEDWMDNTITQEDQYESSL